MPNTPPITSPPTTGREEQAWQNYISRRTYEVLQRAKALWQAGKAGEAFKVALTEQPGVRAADLRGEFYDMLFAAETKEDVQEVIDYFSTPSVPGASLGGMLKNWVEMFEQGNAPLSSGITPPSPAGNVINEFGGVGNQPYGPGYSQVSSVAPAGYEAASSSAYKTYGIMADGQTVMFLDNGVWKIVTDQAERDRVLAYGGNRPGTHEVPNSYTIPTQPGGIGGMTAEYGPYTQFLGAAGLGQGYWNPTQKYLSQMYSPLRWMWEQQQPILRAAGREGETPQWTDYLGRMGAGIQGVQSQARSILSTLLGLTPEKRAEYGFEWEPEYSLETGARLPEEGTPTLKELQDLITMGQTQQYGPYGAAYGASRIPYMQQQWLLQQAAGGAPRTTFVDYLRSKLGL